MISNYISENTVWTLMLECLGFFENRRPPPPHLLPPTQTGGQGEEKGEQGDRGEAHVDGVHQPTVEGGVQTPCEA